MEAHLEPHHHQGHEDQEGNQAEALGEVDGEASGEREGHHNEHAFRPLIQEPALYPPLRGDRERVESMDQGDPSENKEFP